MNVPPDYEKYVAIKITSTGDNCCCFHCWPETWSAVNKYIYPYGPLQDEGDTVIKKDNEKFVLECHESGPEIVVCLAASINLLSAVVNLIVTLLKARQNESKTGSAILRITRHYQVKNKQVEENIIELALPISSNAVKELEKRILAIFTKK